jgi:hypothetical protein
MSKIILTDILTDGELKISSGNRLDLSPSNSYLQLPKGTTLERPANASNGEIRYNTDLKTVEYYDGTQWQEIEIPKDSNEITKAGLVLHLDAGDIESYPGNGNRWSNLNGTIDGTINGGFTYNSNNNGIITFNGSTGHVVLQRPPSITTSGNMTICMWARWTTVGTTTASIQILIDNNHTGSVGFVIQDRPDLAGTPLTASGGLTSTFRVGDGNWHFIAITLLGTSRARMYIDGVLNASNTGSGINPVEANINIANWGRGGRHLNGSIAQTLIYDRELTPGEIWKNYVALAPRFGINPIPSIVTNGLVLNLDAANYQSYPRSGTTWTDLSGQGNNGTLVNGVEYNNSEGGNLIFDGVNDYVDCGNTASLSAIGGTTNITVSGWAYYTAYGGGGQPYSVITAKGSPWTWLLENPLNTFRFRITAGGADVNVADTSTHLLNTWYNVVGTYDGSNMRIYVNGVLKNTRAQTGTLATNTVTAKIGTFQGTNYNVTGKISNISVYNRALSDAEITQNFNAFRTRYGV